MNFFCISRRPQIIHDVDVTADDAGDRLARALDGVRVDAVINNAGGLGSNPGRSWDEQFEDQKFATLDFRVMQRAFEVNTLGPIRVTKALTPKLKESKGKVLIVTSLMGSISDNGSGGAMAYRCAKAAVNMAAATMASELREAGVAVGLGARPGESLSLSLSLSRPHDVTRHLELTNHIPPLCSAPRDVEDELRRRHAAGEHDEVVQARGGRRERGAHGVGRAHDGDHGEFRSRELRRGFEAVPVVIALARTILLSRAREESPRWHALTSENDATAD
jgi:NAD(P)-dependent dehydrogenase (short-subunit alcohol dehydrogenase family)